MYEYMTFEVILQRMLDKVPNTVDKREGSVIYDALAPAALELALAYIEADVILNETFADTASRQYLTKRAAERGIIPEAAIKAILKGEFSMNVPIGSRYSLDDSRTDVNFCAFPALRQEHQSAGAASAPLRGTASARRIGLPAANP